MNWLTRYAPDSGRRLRSIGRTLAVGALLLLGACGAIPQGTGATAAAPGATATLATGGQTGCPAPTRTAPWPSPADAIVSSRSGERSVTLRTGQTLEAQMAWGQKWSALAANPAPTLQMESPAGYGDPQVKSCVWRFTATQAGQTTLMWTIAPLCQPAMACPQYRGILEVQVTVTAG